MPDLTITEAVLLGIACAVLAVLAVKALDRILDALDVEGRL